MRWVAAAGAAVFAVEVGLYVAGSSVEDAHPIWSVRQMGAEVVLDLVVLAFMTIVAFTTFRWTGEQDRLARGTRRD